MSTSRRWYWKISELSGDWGNCIVQFCVISKVGYSSLIKPKLRNIISVGVSYWSHLFSFFCWVWCYITNDHFFIGQVVYYIVAIVLYWSIDIVHLIGSWILLQVIHLTKYLLQIFPWQHNYIKPSKSTKVEQDVIVYLDNWRIMVLGSCATSVDFRKLINLILGLHQSRNKFIVTPARILCSEIRCHADPESIRFP